MLRADLIEAFQQRESTAPSSSRAVEKFAPIKTTTQQSFDKSKTTSPAGAGFQRSVARPTKPTIQPRRGVDAEEAGGGDDPILATGLQHLTLRHVLAAASSPNLGKPAGRPTFGDLARRG